MSPVLFTLALTPALSRKREREQGFSARESKAREIVFPFRKRGWEQGLSDWESKAREIVSLSRTRERAGVRDGVAAAILLIGALARIPKLVLPT